MKTEKSANFLKKAAIALAIVSAALIVIGFFIPPIGVIDGSVFIGVGELMGIQSLFTAWDCIEKGQAAKFSHGKTTLEISGKDDDADNS